jgi:hypothetical protein
MTKSPTNNIVASEDLECLGSVFVDKRKASPGASTTMLGVASVDLRRGGA